MEKAKQACAEHIVDRLKELAALTQFCFEQLIIECQTNLKNKEFAEVLKKLQN